MLVGVDDEIKTIDTAELSKYRCQMVAYGSFGNT